MSASRATDAAGQVKGNEEGRSTEPIEWARIALAWTSKGGRRAVELTSERGADMERVPCMDNKRLARAERKLASRAGTGFNQPLSSVEPKLVEPAPVKASEPAQSRCCLDGANGWRIKFRFRSWHVSTVALLTGAQPLRLSKAGRAGE